MGPYFNSRDKHYKDPFGAVPCGAEVRFALADDTYYGCELLVLREFAGTEDTCRRRRAASPAHTPRRLAVSCAGTASA